MSIANLDNALLKDWCDHCEGKKKFDSYHFSTLLMEAFLDGYTSELDTFLKELTKYFHPSIYQNLAYTFSNIGPNKEDIQKWVAYDLREKRKFLSLIPDAANLVKLIDDQSYSIVHDRKLLYDGIDSDNHSILYDVTGDYVGDHLGSDLRLYALNEVFYNIASDYNLVHGLLSGSLTGDVDFSNYLEIYRRGCDYVVADDKIVIYVHQSES